MANLPDFSDLNLTKGGFYTLVNELRTYLNDSIGAVGSPEGVKLTLELDSVDNTSDLSKPISNATQTALNGKQATLISGTNLKTINNASLLGGGDINLQVTLVSGTNLRTINGTSLLGSGNINTPTVTLSSAIDSDSETEAATSLAVKTLNDIISSRETASEGSVYVYKNISSISFTSESATKIREIVVPTEGTYTVAFKLTSTNTLRTLYGQIYLNGTAVGTLRSLGTASGTYTENITVSRGDLIQLYCHVDYNTNVTASNTLFSLQASKALDFVTLS